MAIEHFLNRHRKVGLDTSLLIFQIEANPRYVPVTHPVFEWLGSGRGSGVTSTITMLEVLVQPYRERARDRVDRFYALLSTYPNLEWAETTLEIADCAARLRADFNLRTPDAIQAATAICREATGFISNDPVFRRIPALDTLLLDDLPTSG